MPKCTPCLSSDLKKVIGEYTNNPEIRTKLEQVRTCSAGEILDLCTTGGRAHSPYQQFISQCMKTKPIKGKPFGEAGKYLKECAAQWRKSKGQG